MLPWLPQQQKNPMKNGSMAAILKHMDANARLHIRSRCPSLSDLEATTPLKIDYFHIDPTIFQINKTTYKLGLIREYLYNCTPFYFPPDWVQRENARGGVDYELPPFGNPFMPEEVEREMGVSMQEINEMKKLQKWGTMPHFYIKLMKVSPKEWDSIPLLDKDEVLKDQEAMSRKIKAIEKRCEATKRRFNILIRLTITSPHRKFPLEDAFYDKPLGKAKEYFAKKVFFLKGRKTRIRTLVVDHNMERWSMKSIMNNRSLIITHLKIAKNVIPTLECIRPWLVEEKFPFETLKICDTVDFHHDLIKNAKTLSVVGLSSEGCLLEITNEKVHRSDRDRFSNDQAAALVQYWKAQKFPIGKHICIDFKNEEVVKNLLRFIETIPDAKVVNIDDSIPTIFPHLVTFPLTCKKEIHVYWQCGIPMDPPSIRIPEWESLYSLNFEIKLSSHQNRVV